MAIGMRKEKTEAELEEERVRESKRQKECWKEVEGEEGRRRDNGVIGDGCMVVLRNTVPNISRLFEI